MHQHFISSSSMTTDAICSKERSSMSSVQYAGVRDSVVNQLLAKMDGVKEANNGLWRSV
jgi:SpoVK/Ycf46/Vps4 family AAA+-type ATPase